MELVYLLISFVCLVMAILTLLAAYAFPKMIVARHAKPNKVEYFAFFVVLCSSVIFALSFLHSVDQYNKLRPVAQKEGAANEAASKR